MMIILADYIADLERNRFLRYQALIEQRGGIDCHVAPAGATRSKAAFEIVYDQARFHRARYRSRFTFSVSNQQEELVTSLDEALSLITFLADQPAWRDKLVAADPTAADDVVVAYFGIDAAATCRASVKPWAEGDFLAPHEDGYAFFYVDTRGALTIRSWSSDVLPVAFDLAAGREGDRVRLSTRIGQIQL